ncbi:MAG: HD domain-containing protein [Corynebacterium sp.]|nr:HD domain-containing protein [Corynebacterium sp.]
MQQLLSPRLFRAFERSAYIHRNQVRKSTQIPYISHLAGVMCLCAQAGGHEDVLIAALLHDALEDVPEEISASDIGVEFGTRVQALVELVTKDDSLPTWQERADAYLSRLKVAPEEYQAELWLLVLADKHYNLSSILYDPIATQPEFWGRFRSTPTQQLWWYREVLQHSKPWVPRVLWEEYRTQVASFAELVAEVSRELPGGIA